MIIEGKKSNDGIPLFLITIIIFGGTLSFSLFLSHIYSARQ